MAQVRVLYIRICDWNKKQMKPLEKSVTLMVSLKVAVGNVKYIFNIDILVN